MKDQSVRWNCAARRSTLPEPADCDWPFCGCDPDADRVLDSILESGYASPNEVRAFETRIAELEEQLRPGSPTERAPTVDAYNAVCAALELTRKERDMYLRGLGAMRDCVADIIKDTSRVAAEARAEHAGLYKTERETG